MTTNTITDLSSLRLFAASILSLNARGTTGFHWCSVAEQSIAVNAAWGLGVELCDSPDEYAVRVAYAIVDRSAR